MKFLLHGLCAGLIAAVIAVAPPHGAARSEPAAAPLPAPIDLGGLKVPHPAPNYDAGKFDLGKLGNDKAEKDKPELVNPSIDLGKSKLQFDTNRSAVDTRVGIETKDPAVLNPGLPSKKATPLTPNYFGLSITTPLH